MSYKWGIRKVVHFASIFVATTVTTFGGQLQLASTVAPALGAPAGGNGDSSSPIVTPDGRFVLFASSANNLTTTSNGAPIPLLFPARQNVYLRDRTNGTTTLVSVNYLGTGGGNGSSMPSAVSTNGRYALFESSASDLVAGDTNGLKDIFLRDLVAGTTTLLSAGTNSLSANGLSRSAAMTPDGRFVAFVSEASNLVPGDTNGIADVFVRDLEAGITILASVGAVGTNAALPTSSSEAPLLTPDGRYVAFQSTASNLVAGPVHAGDVYVRDLNGGVTTRASVDSETLLNSILQATNAICYNHAISDDGNYVAYETSSGTVPGNASSGLVLRFNISSSTTDVIHTNATVSSGTYADIRTLELTPDGRFVVFLANTNIAQSTNSCVEVWDAQSSALALASGDLSGLVQPGSICDFPVISANGRFVSFLCNSTNLVTNSLSGEYHVYVRDLVSNTTALMDADTNGVGVGVGPAAAPSLSADGSLVIFESFDSTLSPNDSNRSYDVFARSISTGNVELLSIHDVALPSLSGSGPSMVEASCLSTNGRYLAFSSEADNLVPGDTNSSRDIFVRDLWFGTNVLVSVATNGASSDGVSSQPSISADGRYVAFVSTGDNLVPSDTNRSSDVFVRDLVGGTTVLCSVSTNGVSPGNGTSYTPTIGPDGRTVVFFSSARNLSTGLTNVAGGDNIFFRNLQTGATVPLTTYGTSFYKLSAGGRYVAFLGQPTLGFSSGIYLWDSQTATRIYTNTAQPSSIALSADGNRLAYAANNAIFVRDRIANTLTQISSLPANATGSKRLGMHFSQDGHFLVYSSGSAQTVPDNNNTNDVYLYDFQAQKKTLVSHVYNSISVPANGASDSPDVSADGRFVVFRSSAPDITAGHTNGVPDLFVYDRLSGSNTLLTLGISGASPGENPQLAGVFGGSRTIAFTSWASDLASGDLNQNGDVLAFNFLTATISAGANNGQAPIISWLAAPGQPYHVQFKDNLMDTQWNDSSGTINYSGNQASFQETSESSTPRFYRVVAF